MEFNPDNWNYFRVAEQTKEGIRGVYMNKPLSIYDKDADLIPVDAIHQFLDCMGQKEIEIGALMPDAHVGYALPIGGVVGSSTHICPAYVGYDIGCGVTTVGTTYDYKDIISCASGIISCMYGEIPTGFEHHSKLQEWEVWKHIAKSDFLKEEFETNGLNQLGTLGGNNHFIEIGKSTVNNRVYITTHSGSRNIGHKVATHYMRLASPDNKVREGHHFFEIKSLLGQQYIRDMTFCMRFAYANRLRLINKTNEIIQYFLKGDISNTQVVNNAHNFAEYIHQLDIWVHRKGATPARSLQRAVIPANRAEGVFIVNGIGSIYSLFSCSHGAGRVNSRKWAKENLDNKQTKEDMKGIEAVTHPDLIDESPRAYKQFSKVMQSQDSLVTISETIKPLINFKDIRNLDINKAFELDTEEE